MKSKKSKRIRRAKTKPKTRSKPKTILRKLNTFQTNLWKTIKNRMSRGTP